MLQFKESVTGFFCTVQGGSNLTFNLSMDKTLWSDHENEEVKLYCKGVYNATQMEATEQYSSVVLFILRYKVVPSFRSMSELLMCDHSVEELTAS